MNRVRLREAGGCAVLVAELRPGPLRLTVLRSLLQFLYDDHSLNRLMNDGLIPRLVAILEEVTVAAGEHDCQAGEGGADSSVNQGVGEQNKEEESDPGPRSTIGSPEPETRAVSPSLANTVRPSPAPVPVPAIPAAVTAMEESAELKSAGPGTGGREEGVAGRAEPVFRICSPSYRAVQYELEQFLQLRSSLGGQPGSPGSSAGAGSPDRSPPPIPACYSPASSPRSTTYSPLLYSPSWDRPDSPPSPPSYSPVYSDEDTEETPPPPSSSPSPAPPAAPTLHRAASIPGQAGGASPPHKRPRVGSSPAYMYSCSSPPGPRPNVTVRPSPVRPAAPSPQPEEGGEEWSVQILSRLAQADRPHPDLTSARTLDCLLEYLARVAGRQPGHHRAARVLTRLSTNIHCLLAWLVGRHMSRLSRQLEAWQAACRCGHFTGLAALLATVRQNLSLLAETGFGEGEICHRLVRPTSLHLDKQSIVVSAALLVRQHKLLTNILVRHDTLDLLLDTLECEVPGLLADSVHSLGRLASCLGLAPCCRDPPVTVPHSPGACIVTNGQQLEDVTLVCDDGTELQASRQLLAASCPVFAAMLGGQWGEADRARIPLPETNTAALTRLQHHLYGCPASCLATTSLPAPDLLQLVKLADRFLLPDLLTSLCHALLPHTTTPQHALPIYRAALQGNYTVECGDRGGNMAGEVVCRLLATPLPTHDRVQSITSIITSDLAQHFLDDASRLLRPKLRDKS